MKYVLDASVASCWVIPRPLTPKAFRLRDEYQRQIHELLAPAFFIDEVAGALTKAERQKDIAVGQAVPLYAKVMNSPPVLIAHAPLIARAIAISHEPAAATTIASTWLWRSARGCSTSARGSLIRSRPFRGSPSRSRPDTHGRLPS